VHTIPDALATSTAATRSKTCSCSSSSISCGSLITTPLPRAASQQKGLPWGLGQEAENLTGVLVATVRDPKVKAPRQTVRRAHVPEKHRRQRATHTDFHASAASPQGIPGLIADPDTGMQVMKMIYRAGFTNPWHTHDCAHGIYVLDGTLTTHRGDYGPGSFVWFPEGGSMHHGAGTEQDCTFLFITNKPFDIHFVGDENDPAAPTV
jgi:quercetin dioxygenase-like cupin family protein